MPIPKTNLFKGDRVKLSSAAIRVSESCATPGGSGRVRGYNIKTMERVGTIVSNTLSTRANGIQVLWDGTAHVCKESYQPWQLRLYEEEYETPVSRIELEPIRRENG